MSNPPVYRRPRSHAYACRCRKCARSRPDSTAAVIFWGGLAAIAVAFWPEWALHGRASVIAGIAWWGSIATIGVLILAAYLAGKRSHARPKPAPPSGPPMSSLPPAPWPAPVCRHLGAVKVDAFDKTLIYCCWCPDCEAELPANFRRPCCRTEPGNPHWYSCPERVTT